LTGCGRTSGLRRTLGRGVVRAEDGCAWTARMAEIGSNKSKERCSVRTMDVLQGKELVVSNLFIPMGFMLVDELHMAWKTINAMRVKIPSEHKDLKNRTTALR